MCLCHVLYDLEAAPLRQLVYGLHVADTPVEMHHHDGAGTLRDELFDALRIDEIVLQARLAQHRLQAGTAHRQDAGNVGVGGHDDLVVRLPAEHPPVGEQYHRQGIQSVARRHAVLRAAVCREGLAEAHVLLSEQIPPAPDHARHLGRQLRLEAVVHAPEVEVGDRPLYISP